jgi:hypothetical protein
MKGSGHCLIYDPFPLFAWRGRKKTPKTAIKLAGLGTGFKPKSSRLRIRNPNHSAQATVSQFLYSVEVLTADPSRRAV